MTPRIRRPAQPRLLLWRNLYVTTVVPMLLLCQKIAFAKLFESKKRKLARLQAELAKLEEERLESLVVFFGYEFDKLGFYTATSIVLVLFVASIVQLSRSRRKWKRLAIFGGADSNLSQSTEYHTGWLSSKRNISLLIAASIYSYYVIFNLGRATKSSIGYARPRKRGSLADTQIFVLVFGTYQLDETTFYSLLVTSMVVLVALGYNIGIVCRKLQEKRSKKQRIAKENALPKEEDVDVIDVIVVDCGLPKKDIGWFHLMQFLDMSNINVRAVVEPFYLDKGKCPQPPQSFVDLVSVLIDLDVECVKSLGQLDPCERKTLCVLAGRTDRNPQYFRECIGLGATHIYLEPPGSAFVGELEKMSNLANVRGVQVFMGYQKTCSPYIEKTVAFSRSIPKCHVFFCHNEDYFKEDLHRVLNRHPEGMIRSMASQDLAVLVTQFEVTATNVKVFKVNTNQLFSAKQTFCNKANGNEVSDFSRVAFKITTTNGRNVSVMADRCGGKVSFAVVKSIAGKEIKKFVSPDGDSASRIDDELKRDTEMMHQFTIEGEDYMELKRRVVDSILGREDDGKSPKSVISIQDGIEVLRLSNYCAKEIESVLQ